MKGTIGRITKRELEVLELMVRGLTTKELSERLCISEGTVKQHLYNIFKKMNVKNRTQAAVKFSNERFLASVPQ